MKRFVSTFVAVALWTASNLAAGQPTTQEAADSIKQAAASNPDEPHRVISSGARQELELNPNEPITLTLSTTQPTKLNLSTTQPGQEFNLEFVATPPQPTLWNTRDIVGSDGQLVGVEATSATGKASEAYMGVGVDAPDATLRAQLSLPADSGLVVSYLDDQGPAKSSVQLHDILRKLDDQLLINAEQFAALVRTHKPGDTVSLTLIRQAKSITVQMELGRRKTLPESGASARVSQLQSNAGTSTSANPTFAVGGAILDTNPHYGEMLDKSRLSLPPNVDVELGLQYLIDGKVNSKFEPRAMTFNDGDLVVVVTPRGNLEALNARDGQVVFQGPIHTQQEWDAIPDAVRQRLAAWREVIHPVNPATRPGAVGR